MTPSVANLSFNAWATGIFCPTSDGVGRPPVYRPTMPAADAETIVLYMTQIFEQPVYALDLVEDAQLAEGFRYLAWGSGYFRALGDPRVDLRARLRCISAFATLMGSLFVVRCSHHLSFRGHNPKASPLNYTALDLWEALFAQLPKDDGPGRLLNCEALRALEETLYQPSVACQEGALYGLSHWQPGRPEEVAEIISGFQARLSSDAKCLGELAGMVQSGALL
jgi:hypothetical protein